MKKLRLFYLISFFVILLAEILIALFVNDRFIRPYLGDVLVTVLICCFVRIFFPSGIKWLPVYVFLFATAVEIGQYFDMVKLLGLESSKFLSVLMGRSFSFIDLICYAAGCILFFIINRRIDKTPVG